jgi:hypothetical protein
MGSKRQTTQISKDGGAERLWLASHRCILQHSNTPPLHPRYQAAFKASSFNALAISRISSSAVRNMPLQDLLRGTIDRPSRVLEKQPLLLRGHLPEEIARLLPVIIL